MAESISRQEKRKVLQERYGSAFAPPLKNNTGGRPKGSKNKKKTSDPNTITPEKMMGENAD